jgi:DNA-binding HxlR family transcriptional regulator
MSLKMFRVGYGVFERMEVREQEVLAGIYKKERLCCKDLAEQISMNPKTLNKKIKHLENLRMVSAEGYPKEYQLTEEVKGVLDALHYYANIGLLEVGHYYLTGNAKVLERDKGGKRLVRTLEEYGKFLKSAGVYIE